MQPAESFLSSRAVFSLVESAGAEATGGGRCDHRGRDARADSKVAGLDEVVDCRLSESRVRCGAVR